MFRHFRACHMVTKYDFNIVELCSFFGWEDQRMALYYAQLKTVEDKFFR